MVPWETTARKKETWLKNVVNCCIKAVISLHYIILRVVFLVVFRNALLIFYKSSRHL